MWKYISIYFLSILVLGCSADAGTVEGDTLTQDTNAVVSVPTFDISGPFKIKWNDQVLNTSNGDEGPFVSILNANENDTLYIQYSSQTPCEECRLETQIWVDSKYKDVVRDTGYGTGDWTRIPLSQLNYNPEQTDGQSIAFYLSVRQYHPVETGNKRYLFNLKLKFAAN